MFVECSPLQDKAHIGWVPSPNILGPHSSPLVYPISRANLKKGREDFDIGNCSSLQRPSIPSDPWSPCLLRSSGIGSLRGPLPRKLMFGKSRQEWANLSSLDLDRSAEILQPIGIPSDHSQLPGRWGKFLVTYSYVITDLSRPLRRTIANRLLSKDPQLYYGAELVLESRCALGVKPERQHILKILVPSSGVATAIRKMLLSMSFEVQSTFRTFSDGLIVIRSEWRLKVEADHLSQSSSGSLPISTPVSGIRNSIPQHLKRYVED